MDIPRTIILLLLFSVLGDGAIVTHTAERIPYQIAVVDWNGEWERMEIIAFLPEDRDYFYGEVRWLIPVCGEDPWAEIPQKPTESLPLRPVSPYREFLGMFIALQPYLAAPANYLLGIPYLTALLIYGEPVWLFVAGTENIVVAHAEGWGEVLDIYKVSDVEGFVKDENLPIDPETLRQYVNRGCYLALFSIYPELGAYPPDLILEYQKCVYLKGEEFCGKKAVAVIGFRTDTPQYPVKLTKDTGGDFNLLLVYPASMSAGFPPDYAGGGYYGSLIYTGDIDGDIYFKPAPPVYDLIHAMARGRGTLLDLFLWSGVIGLFALGSFVFVHRSSFRKLLEYMLIIYAPAIPSIVVYPAPLWWKGGLVLFLLVLAWAISQLLNRKIGGWSTSRLFTFWYFLSLLSVLAVWFAFYYIPWAMPSW